MDKEFIETYDYLVNNDLFTEQELELVTCINGNSIETLNDCIYVRYGYRDLQQLKEVY